VAVVVDDVLLLDVLADRADTWLAEELASNGLYTTGAWYYRLGRAVAHGTGVGALSSRLAALGPGRREAVLSLLGDLPDNVGLISARASVPVMIALRVRRPVNVLAAEALAVALLADAAIAVTTDTPLLHAAAQDLGVEYRVV
jgi:hypothetical protein